MNVNNDSSRVGLGSETFWGFSGIEHQVVVLRPAECRRIYRHFLTFPIF